MHFDSEKQLLQSHASENLNFLILGIGCNWTALRVRKAVEFLYENAMPFVEIHHYFIFMK
jgi:hypothetical protein